MGVPGPVGVELVTMEHGHRVAAGNETRLVEGVDRHVQHERTPHLLAEAAEVRSAVEVGVEDAQVAQLLCRDDGLRGADRRAVAAVLHHGAGQAAAPGEGGGGASLFHRGGQRLLAQHVTAGLQRRGGHRGVRFGNGDVAHHRRRGLGDRPLDGSEVRHSRPTSAARAAAACAATSTNPTTSRSGRAVKYCSHLRLMAPQPTTSTRQRGSPLNPSATLLIASIPYLALVAFSPFSSFCPAG